MSSRFPRFGIVCMGVGFTLLGIFSLLVAVMLLRGEWRYLIDGARALGRVRSNETHTETRPGGPRTVYELLYIFQDAGQIAHTGKDSVRADIWARAKPGDPLAIEYVAAEPAVNRIVRGSSTGILGALIAAPVGAVLVGLGIFLLANPGFKLRNPKTQIRNSKLP
jgi:hypothetical protein